MSRTSSILNRVFSDNKKKSSDLFSTITRIHHDMMKEYGWIPLDEFYSLPMDFINQHVEHINDDRTEQNKSNKKGSKRRR